MPGDPLPRDAGCAVPTAALGAIDALATLALRARRQGCRLVLRDVPQGLYDLLVLAGLVEPGGPLLVESQRQTEHREHAVGVEEEREADDPAR